MNDYKTSSRIISLEPLGYDTAKYNKKDLSPFYYFTKKGFKEFSDDSENEPRVIGDVFINRKEQKDIEQNGDIIGIIKVPYSYEYLRNNPDASDKEYALFKPKKKWRKTIGYAQIENQQYVRLVKYDTRFLFLILLLLLALIPLFCHSCSNFEPIVINTGNGITETDNRTEPTPICYCEPFNEITELTKESPEINLKNVATNDNTFFVSYEIYIDGVVMKDESGNIFTTGAIPPNRQVNVNLWNQLEKGVYQLDVKATDYDYKILSDINDNKDKYSDKEYQSLLTKATMPVKHTLSTTLIINK